MKKAAFLLTVISLLMVSGCGGLDMFLPSYGVNEVPETFFTDRPSDGAVVFPSVAALS